MKVGKIVPKKPTAALGQASLTCTKRMHAIWSGLCHLMHNGIHIINISGRIG